MYLLAPNRALDAALLRRPPMTKVGSSPACPKIDATRLVVVVFPCVPAIAMPCLYLINSPSISARRTTGIRFAFASTNSGFESRIAEEMTLGPDGITTGAANDIEQATKMVRAMVTKWGLSEELGPLMYAEEDEEVFLGKSAGSTHAHVSGETAAKIDKEIRAIIDDCYATAKQVLEDNRDKLEVMTDTLMEYETIDRPQIEDIMNGLTPRPPKGWDDSDDTPPTGASPEPSDPEPSGPIGDPAADH